jgi:hypothetical protein
MADSDVVVLLDTPGFRASRWTREELARANATNIQILHLLWPAVMPDESSAFSEFVSLTGADFKAAATLGEDARLMEAKVSEISTHVESLRARALAARHRSLVDDFCARAREENARFIAVQPERFVSVELASGDLVTVVPTIGVPSAHVYHEIERAIHKTGTKPKAIWLLYDERGILDSWIQHLDWLDAHLPVISVQVTKSNKYLRVKGLGTEVARRIILYQSAFFTDQFGKENDEFLDVRLVPAVANSPDRSLRMMRERMIGDTPFNAGVFIGGMEGVLDEFAMFGELHPRAARWPIASTGAAAQELFEKQGARRPDLFADEMTYSTLFRRLLAELPTAQARS